MREGFSQIDFEAELFKHHTLNQSNFFCVMLFIRLTVEPHSNISYELLSFLACARFREKIGRNALAPALG